MKTEKAEDSFSNASFSATPTLIERLVEIQNKHSCSDNCIKDILNLLNDYVSPDVSIPSLYQMKEKTDISSWIFNKIVTEEFEMYLLNFPRMIESILTKNHEHILKNRSNDVTEDVCGFDYSEDVIHLIINSDGGQLKNSSKTLWPIFMTIAELPHRR